MKVKDVIRYEEYADFPEAGVRFIDLTPSLLDVYSRNEIVQGLIRLIDDTSQIDYMVSPDARGFIWGSMVAQKLGLGFIPVRKPGKLPNDAILSSAKYETEYSKTELCMPMIELDGKRVLFVDDVYATGGTYRAIEQIVDDYSGILLGGIVLVDIELDKNPNVKSLVKVRELKK